jgi:riboflavin kinase/FMN adenylyltransferase
VEGVVVHGDGRGRDLGFPTANVQPAPHSALPGTGIYAGTAHLADRVRPAAVSVGYNPTFTDARDQLRIEAHLLDFDSDVYGRHLRIDLNQRLRGEQKFGSVDELVAQVQRDIAAVREMAARA